MPAIPIVSVVLLLVSATALPGKSEFQLVGKILQSDGTPFGRKMPVSVFLYGTLTPFSAETQAELDGRFRFKNLPAGTYNLVVNVQRAGEIRKTIEVGPSFADSKGRVAVTLTFEQAGRLEKGQLVSATELSIPADAKREYDRAEECLSRRDIDCAISHLNKAVAIGPQYALAWNRLGTIAYQTQKYQQAEEYFREALKQDPQSYSPLVNLGGALLSQGKVKESLSVNEAAVRARPDDALAHSQLGKSYYFLDQLDDAESHLKQAKALDPSHFSYPGLVLIDIYLRKNRVPDAVTEIEEFMKLHPDSEWTAKLRKFMEDSRAQPSPKP